MNPLRAFVEENCKLIRSGEAFGEKAEIYEPKDFPGTVVCKSNGDISYLRNDDPEEIVHLLEKTQQIESGFDALQNLFDNMTEDNDGKRP